MDNARQQIVDSIKKSSNILVTVSSDPSVDELSAALGLTIILNNMDKRATAIFSGTVPPAIDFLEPGKTFESSADSLRDFIIALNKEKADHLRYKVEGDVVKIFITPYKTTLSRDDLEFSQGDYNVDMILGLGVKDQGHLDKSLEAHGKILHDATVATITAGNDASTLGSIDWHDATASSLSEMIVGMADSLKDEGPILDEQIATALLTGIVSATARFSNDHTTSRAMTMAAQLMAAGANQQLIAAKLEEAHDIGPSKPVESKKKSDDVKPAEKSNELTIERDKKAEPEKPAEEPKKDEPAEAPKDESKDEPKEESQEEPAAEPVEKSNEEVAQEKLEKELAGLTATAAPEAETQTLEDIENELKQATKELTESQDAPAADASAPADSPVPSPVESTPEADKATLPVPAPETISLPPMEAPDVSSSAPVTPELPPLNADTSPQIVNEHGTFSAPQDTMVSPINSIQNNPLEGEPAAVDPFKQPIIPQKANTIEPNTPAVGTAEGAAVLASEPAVVVPPVLAPAPAPPTMTIPELPPLPPLPDDLTLPPLPPPPPPPPTFGQPPTGEPSGAVSGDVFGDGAAPASTPTPAPATPPSPGQFKIPGS